MAYPEDGGSVNAISTNESGNPWEKWQNAVSNYMMKPVEPEDVQGASSHIAYNQNYPNSIFGDGFA